MNFQKQLEYLYFNGSELSTFSPTDCFAGMKNLEELILQNNKISYLPDGMFDNLSKLRYLDLDNNNISDLSEICTNLPQLFHLSLSHNLLTTISLTDCFAGMINLEELALMNNEISYLPNGMFANLSKLRYLDLDYNIISDPSGLCTDLPQLYRLSLRHNALTIFRLRDCFAEMFSLEVLDLRDNNMSQLPAGMFDNLLQLRIVHLDNNNISDPGICTNLHLFTNIEFKQ